MPGWRGEFTAVYDGEVIANSTSPLPWKFRYRRSTAGWDGDPWYTRQSDDPDDGTAPAMPIKAMNPAHVIYQCLTDRRWARGLDASTKLDDTAWKAAADQLHAEGFGYCHLWERQDTVLNYVQTVLDTIGGVHLPGSGHGAAACSS